jgi:hypothetical protein
MKPHKRVLLELLIRLMPLVRSKRFEKLPREYRLRSYALLEKVARYTSRQPTRYDVSKEQVDRAEDLYNMAVGHYNSLLDEGATGERLDRVRLLYQLAETEMWTAHEARTLDMRMQISDMEEGASEEQREP